jgi:hypothetical protein
VGAERDNPVEVEVLCEGSVGTTSQPCFWEGREREEEEGDCQCSVPNSFKTNQEAALGRVRLFLRGGGVL